MANEIKFRPEHSGDLSGIRAVEMAAFETPAEANLVDVLRSDGSSVLSLVAEHSFKVVGNVMFSKMRSPDRTVGLAPVAVVPEYRRQGVAAALIWMGLKQLKADGWQRAFVFGGPYYLRFGFSQHLATGYSSRYSGPHLMGLELQPGALSTRSGLVEYPRAFDGF